MGEGRGGGGNSPDLQNVILNTEGGLFALELLSMPLCYLTPSGRMSEQVFYGGAISMYMGG